MHGNLVRALVMVPLAGVLGCAWPTVEPTPGPRPSAQELAQLWVDPGPVPRRLTAGVGGEDPHLRTDARYDVLSTDTRGFSTTYRVRDERGREWAVKIGPEAQPEVVTSRILWAVGYHQVPSYFVERWTAVEHGRAAMRGGARFRPRDLPMKGLGSWAWQRNPFIGTREFNGLLSLLMLVNSSDLKNDNNEIYELTSTARESARRWYVVKDLGASLGETGRIDPRRGYLDGFEREPFLLGVRGPFVRFAFKGRHQELVQQIPITDLQWICRRVLALTDAQWRDAFRAANYSEGDSGRYVARLRDKAREGLALP